MPPAHDDIAHDALALIECMHNADLVGAQVLLDNGNTRLIAAFLGRLCCDLIEGLMLEDDPGAFGRIREHYAGGG